MSSYIEPNIYLFESFLEHGLYMNLQNGGKADGTKVLVNPPRQTIAILTEPLFMPAWGAPGRPKTKMVSLAA
ncbi:hypothetical protein BST61_g557 [Cercospora zeina]